MMKIFVILVFCGVVFGDFAGHSQTRTVLPSSSPRSTVAPKSTSIASVTNSKITRASSASRVMDITTVVSQTPHSAKTSSSMLNSSPVATISPKPTISPNSTTGPKPTPTPTPKTTSKPIKPTTQYPGGNFSLQENGTSNFCLLAEFEATFTIKYKTMSGTKLGTVVKYLNRSNSADVAVTGDCGINATTSSLKLSWPQKNISYVLIMEFKKTRALSTNSNKSTNWEWSKVTFKVTVQGNKDFKNVSRLPHEVESTNNNTKATFKSKLGSYYKCDAIENMELENDLGGNFTVSLSFMDLKLEPFVNSTDGRFNGTHDDCPADNPSPPHPTTEKPKSGNDIVPIAVGCALAGLVLIVLIAYVIGRRKSHSGYEKV